MDSRQEPRETREDRAEAAARVAADELAKSRESELGREQREAAAAERQQRPGVIGSLVGAVQHAKEAIVGKSHETAERAGETTEAVKLKAAETKDYTAQSTGEYKDSAAQKAAETRDNMTQKTEEYKDSAAQKAKETKDSAAQKAKETKDSAAQKAKETKDAAAEKARETKDETAEKTNETKDAAAEKARRAVDYLSGKKEETKQKTAETAEEAKEKTGEAGEATRQKMEGLKLRKREDKDEVMTSEAAGQRAEEAKGGILSSLGNVTEAIKEKFTGPKEVVEQSEQMHGQTFNYVGSMGEEP